MTSAVAMQAITGGELSRERLSPGGVAMQAVAGEGGIFTTVGSVGGGGLLSGRRRNRHDQQHNNQIKVGKGKRGRIASPHKNHPRR